MRFLRSEKEFVREVLDEPHTPRVTSIATIATTGLVRCQLKLRSAVAANAKYTPRLGRSSAGRLRHEANLTRFDKEKQTVATVKTMAAVAEFRGASQAARAGLRRIRFTPPMPSRAAAMSIP